MRLRMPLLFAPFLLIPAGGARAGDPSSGRPAPDARPAPGTAPDARPGPVRVDAISSPLLPPPVAGFPIGWCIRVQGTTPEDARAAGYEYIELAMQDVLGLSDEEFEALVKRLRALGIPARTGYNLIPNDLKVVGPDVDRKRQDEHLARALTRAERLGLAMVVFGSGPARRVPDGFSPARAFEQLVDFSRRAAAEAARHKLQFLVQPLRNEDTNLINTVPEAMKLVKAVARPNFHILVDYSFLIIQKEDPSVLLAARGHVRHVWIANPNGRVYPMAPGEADYASFFQALAKIGYRGGLSIHAKTQSYAADAPRAITFLRKMAAENLVSRRR
jgi:sugar phosphate isomerase/epimerase